MDVWGMTGGQQGWREGRESWSRGPRPWVCGGGIKKEGPVGHSEHCGVCSCVMSHEQDPSACCAETTPEGSREKAG